MPSGARFVIQALIDLGVVGAAVYFAASYFPASLIFSTTTTNGGDMASHYYPAVYLREVLLPRWQLMGWCPGNYAGYPLFQFYFPLPFVLIAVLSMLGLALTVAFKVVTILGVLMLPPCAYLCLRLAGTPFPGPALGAVSTLCFLFMEANSMWGGNIPSTLAGEFTFSIGLALVVLFVGSLRRTVETGRGRIANGLLVATIGLCHGYTLLWGGLVSLTELVSTRGWWRRFGTLVMIHGLAILLMAFWLVPLLLYAPWTTAFNPVWVLDSWKEVLPPILWPAAGIAVSSALVQGGLSWWRGTPFPRELATIWAGIFISFLFYETAYSFHVVDIRFMPFFQLGLCLAAAAGLGRLLAMLPGPEVWPVVGALAAFPFVQSHVSFIPAWVKWNYSGFEEKRPWPVFRDLNAHLKGDFRDPRVVYEHSPSTESLGTVRAFESLPLFSGRSTLEGLYMQSSLTTPFVFYVQSEISKAISCPLPGWGCTRLNLDRGVDHLRMFNVSQFIVRSPEVKRLANAHPALEKEMTAGQYEIHRVVGNDGRYAVPLELAPSLVRTELGIARWKEIAYQWFKRAGPDDPVPVFADGAAPGPGESFAGVYDLEGTDEELPRELARRSLGDPPALEERFEPGRLTVTGTRPGHPILVRVSYHPRWEAVTGERVWLAAPNFLLVFPKGDRVELVFGAGPVLKLGRVLTAIGVVIVLGALMPAGRRFGQNLLARAGTLPVARGAVAVARRMAARPLRVRRRMLGSALATVGVVLGTFVLVTSGTDADTMYRNAQKLYGAGKLEEALPLFKAAHETMPYSATAVHARYFEAIIHFRQEQWKEAEALFSRIVEVFPEAANAPEALYHLGICRARLADLPGAFEAWEAVAGQYPETNWAKYARDRLKEHGRTFPQS